MTARSCELPGGLFDAEGHRHREVEFEPLCGRDEELLAGASAAPGAALVSALLARCVRRVGGWRSVGENLTRELLVADRQFLLLRLREATFGERVDADLPCPWPGCGKKFSVSFSVNQIPVEVPEPLRQVYRFDLPDEAVFEAADGGRCASVSFRLPNGADQEALAELARVDEPRAATGLMARCVLPFEGLDGAALVDSFTPRTRAAVEAEMDRVAPKLQSTLEADCPECGREISVPLDIHEFFFGDLRTSLDLLRREIHYLAYHYHWSEHEIMAMPRNRRRDYIRVLAEEIEQLNSAL